MSLKTCCLNLSMSSVTAWRAFSKMPLMAFFRPSKNSLSFSIASSSQLSASSLPSSCFFSASRSALVCSVSICLLSSSVRLSTSLSVSSSFFVMSLRTWSYLLPFLPSISATLSSCSFRQRSRELATSSRPLARASACFLPLAVTSRWRSWSYCPRSSAAFLSLARRSCVIFWPPWANPARICGPRSCSATAEADSMGTPPDTDRGPLALAPPFPPGTLPVSVSLGTSG